MHYILVLNSMQAKADHNVAEEQLERLQEELSKANQVHTEYLNQKQENVLLKETIDRLRYDLDDLRSAHANDSTKGGSSAPGSAKPSLSRTLGSELLRRLNPHESVQESTEDDSDTETTVEETVEEQTENTDGDEDVFQTIITRKRVCLYLFFIIDTDALCRRSSVKENVPQPFRRAY